MIKNNKNRKGFTLIELLVVIAIIAILAVVVVLTLNPAELLRQARDSNRISDFATLKSALGLYSEDVATTTWMSGSSTSTTSTIFYSGPIAGVTVAIATSTTGCVTGTPAVGGWGFLAGETVASTAARSINGTGWVPINFGAISSGAPIGSLPVDPTNTGTNLYMYVGAQTTYKLATHMESAKYSQGGPSDVVSSDGGNSVCTYEQGSNLQL
ncbi:MAG TPA: type II secretion system protein [Candidatus Paceibacterota bacterium]